MTMGFDRSRAAWFKSSRSNGNHGDCVEVAIQGQAIGVRDSKQPDGSILVFDRPSWTHFLGDLRTGRIRP